MKFVLSILFICSINFLCYAQQYFIHGKVTDKNTGSSLSYTNIRVMNSTIGTSSNKNGEYEIRLNRGNYKLIASYIGYNSDTISVNLEKNIYAIDFKLNQINIKMPEVTVKPGINPALSIIKRAIEKKNERNKKLKSYEFEAYTKAFIKTPNEIRARGHSVSIGLNGGDTSALKITGIIENESRGYFKKPNYYKEEIIARKQTANFPSTINMLTGGRVLQNFYSDQVNFLGIDIPGPLADNALKYYYYYIKKILAINKKQVYEIYMTPDDPSDPGFTGNIYITDSTYDLIKVDLELNRAANPGGIFDTVNVLQQYTEFKDSIYMPIDYRIFATVSLLSLVKFNWEINTVLYDYKINPDIKTGFFNKAILTVLPGADNKDSTYWKNAVTIPSTKDEIAAYKRIDSLQNIPESFWDKFNILSSRINLTNDFAISAPLGMYHFNRVEGNSLDYGFYLNGAEDQRLTSSLNFTYGFSDKRLKTDFNGSYFFGDYRTYKISLKAYNKLNILFNKSDDYNDITATILALVSKDDFRDYYYSKGFNIDFSGEVFPVMSLSAGYENHTDKNAFKNTEFSFFAKDRTFRPNPPIFETNINALNFGINFDFRDYIEDGYFRRRISFGRSFFTFGGGISISNKNILKSDLNYIQYNAKGMGIIHTFKSAELDLRIASIYTEGELPYQMLFSLPGNINLTAQNYTFRTLNINEILGDRVVTVYINHYFGDELFRLLNIPYVKDWELQLNTYLNIAYSNIGSKSKAISPYPIKTFKHPFFEAGFSIGQILFPININFTWRLNYRGENNFRIGLSSFIL